MNQKVARQLVHKLGYTADVVGDGVEVLEAMNRIRYDVILMDCQMPELDGYETTRRLRRSEGGRYPWIIALTASAMAGERERCLALGMDDFLTKPVRLEDLRAALDRGRPGHRGLPGAGPA